MYFRTEGNIRVERFKNCLQTKEIGMRKTCLQLLKVWSENTIDDSLQSCNGLLSCKKIASIVNELVDFMEYMTIFVCRDYICLSCVIESRSISSSEMIRNFFAVLCTTHCLNICVYIFE